ncbi:MAG: hypothetical protein ACK493_02895 [Planctomycetota bacterium]|jgi:uncharacterized membrane protein|nr:hypothetical protein [Blastopirellula sp.]
MSNLVLLVAAAASFVSRLGLCAMFAVVGVILMLSGLHNIQTQNAEESGKRRLVNKALGQGNSYTGSKAVLVGWIRIISGGCAILFAFLFLIYSLFFAR